MSELSTAAWWFPPLLWLAIYVAGVVSGILWYRRKGDAEVSRLVNGWKTDRDLLRARLDAYAVKVEGRADHTLDRLDAEFERFVSKFEK